MSDADFPSLWNVPANPVFRRHAVARLRPGRFVAWVLVTQLLAAFVWCVAASATLHAASPGGKMPLLFSEAFSQLWVRHGPAASLAGWMAVLVLQGLIVILKGTFSVATGVAREAAEGMIEAEHLTPLPTWHKVVGQLLGLPVLETAVAALLLVWAALSAWLGHLSPAMMGRVYLVFGTSALFHHAVGLVAGSLIRQKILAGTLSQLLIVFLHFVLPMLSRFRIGVVSHLGAEAAIVQEITAGTPPELHLATALRSPAARDAVEFFHWQVSLSGYQWVVTVTALAALLVVLARRWAGKEGPLLGHAATAALGAWILVLTCGELLPGIWRGEGAVGPRRDVLWGLEIVGRGADFERPAAIFWMAAFAVVLSLLNFGFTSALTMPTARGRDSLPWVTGLSLLTAGAWLWPVAELLRHTPALRGLAVEWRSAAWMAAAFTVPAWAWHGMVRWKGWRGALLAGFIVWTLPVMVVVVGLLLTANADGWPAWLASVSGPVLPLLACTAEIIDPGEETVRTALRTSLLVHAVVAVWLLAAVSRRTAREG